VTSGFLRRLLVGRRHGYEFAFSKLSGDLHVVNECVNVVKLKTLYMFNQEKEAMFRIATSAFVLSNNSIGADMRKQCWNTREAIARRSTLHPDRQKPRLWDESGCGHEVAAAFLIWRQ
jgi:hypothetical protein